MDVMITVGNLRDGSSQLDPQRVSDSQGALATYGPAVLIGGNHAAVWLTAITTEQLDTIISALTTIWSGSESRVTWREPGEVNVILPGGEPVVQDASSRAAAPAPGVLGSEPKPPSDLFAPPAGEPNLTGFARS